jgi:hypothetical protein
MSFRYACFISYCHGQSELTKTFIEQLKDALKNYLDPYLDEEVYIDKERLQPGFLYNEALAKAICESICMIVVYSPKYEQHSYCLREYQAMEHIEKKRMQLLGERAISERGMIIPIIFRGKIEDLPPKIKKCIHYADFSKFTLATLDLSSNPDYTEQIEKIAKYIYKYFEFFREIDVDVCGDCNSFRLPYEEEIQPWREKSKKPMPFPGRGVKQ